MFYFPKYFVKSYLQLFLWNFCCETFMFVLYVQTYNIGSICLFSFYNLNSFCNFKWLHSLLRIQVTFSFIFKISVKTRTCSSSYNFVSTQLDWNSWNRCQSHQCPVWQPWDPQKTGCEAARGTATVGCIQSAQSSELSLRPAHSHLMFSMFFKAHLV